MFRCLRLFILLPLCVLGQADVLLSTPSKSFTFPTDQPIWEETPPPTIPSSTKGSANAVTGIATTFEPNLPNDTTSQPALDISDATTVELTTPPTLQSTSSTMAPLSSEPTNATTPLPTPEPTNATTPLPTPEPTNATTPLPTPEPTNATTPLPTPEPTNATTPLPTPEPTNATTPLPTPEPTTLPVPEVGDYVVRAEQNSSACLRARMGLQFSFRMGDGFQTINLDPNATKPTGTCGNNGSDSALVLISDKIIVQFVFTNQTSKFFLSGLNLTVVPGSGPNFNAVSTNLSLWEASLGSSYMCKKEQSFNISGVLILNTFELQVQPFGVTNDQFSTAHECSVDDASLLIPIIVGAALAVLILIVVIAYVIGRRKTYVGYQTL
ncbi:lysosome-associated membrane glycoprotein 2 isoform X2 [Tachysurus fulvidraco]|nr:lysosome-associated membrane glycoprotein 2 isoform X2 [Tachysurus fulvidraco]